MPPEKTTRLDFWRTMKGWTYEKLGNELGVKTQSAWRYCVLPSHKDHRQPGRVVAQKLREVSEGVVHLGNYSDLVTIQEEAA